MKLELFDNREGLVFLDSLGMHPNDSLAPAAPAEQPKRFAPRWSPRFGRSGQRNARTQHQDHHRREQTDERYELEHVEDSVDQRERQYADEAANTVAAPAPVLASGPSESSELDDEEGGNVIDVDEASEPIGEMPGEIDEPHDNGRNRNRRGGRGGRGRDIVRPQANKPPPKKLPPVIQPPVAKIEPPEPGNEGMRRSKVKKGRRVVVVGGAVAAIAAAASCPQQHWSRAANERSDRRRRRWKKIPKRMMRSTIAPERVPPPREPDPPVVRTGSTDKHLIHDEPVLPDPPRRPRSVRDLDAIPDDLD